MDAVPVRSDQLDLWPRQNAPREHDESVDAFAANAAALMVMRKHIESGWEELKSISGTQA